MIQYSNTMMVLSPIPGYAFLIFQEESSVHALINSCQVEDGKLFIFVSSVTQTNKKVSYAVMCTHVVIIIALP